MLSVTYINLNCNLVTFQLTSLGRTDMLKPPKYISDLITQTLIQTLDLVWYQVREYLCAVDLKGLGGSGNG
jgi:hypothetical protein